MAPEYLLSLLYHNMRFPDRLLGKGQYLGYAHGAAGIADSLLDLFETTGEERFAAPALQAARWLAQLATPTAGDARCLAWPGLVGEAPTAPFWCHGAAGIGRLFLHMARLGLLPEAARIAEGAARATARHARWANPTQCHGLSGNIEFLLDCYQTTGKEAWLTEARSLATLLQAFAVERLGHLYYPSEHPTTLSPNYLVGFAGVAVCLLRLAEPESRPRQLSRAGFRFAMGNRDDRESSCLVSEDLDCLLDQNLAPRARIEDSATARREPVLRPTA